jgi:predicted DNA-binding protein with PD1-like motif
VKEMLSEGRLGKICFSRLSEGEDLAEAIQKRVEEHGIKAGIFILIGSLKGVTLGYYKEGEYKSIRLDGPLEIASCMGNISVDTKGETVIHPHIVIANERGEAFGGHLMKGSTVGATAVNLKRAFDEKTKLNLLKLT